MARKTKGERIALYEGLLRATRDFADLAFRVAGPNNTTAAQATPLLEAYLEAVKRTRRADAVLADAILAERKALEKAHPTAERLKAAVRARLGDEAPLQKARATREPRGTKGRRRRARGG